MAAQKWTKAPPEHIEAFSAALPLHPMVERRTMFGYPCAFLNGNMFTGLHQDNICVRLGREEASIRIEKGDAQLFAPMAGRVMKDYVAIPKADCGDVSRLKPWLDEALHHALTLAPKAPKAKSARAPAAPGKARKRTKS